MDAHKDRDPQHFEDDSTPRPSLTQITLDKAGNVESERRPEAQGRDKSQVAPGYFYSPGFIGTYIAIGFGFAAATGGYALISPLLQDIDQDIGPSPYLTWISIAYQLGQTIFFMLSGRLSDMFGRRYFFIIGATIGLIGNIIGATAQTVNQLIASEALIGAAAGFQISFFWVVSEIVPMNRRFIANSGCYFITIPTNALAPFIAINIQAHTAAKWRGCFYYMIAVQAVSLFCWIVFYHPPTFKMLYRTKTLWQIIKAFDFVGLLLFTAGLLLLLLGLQWGGSLYPWKSTHVIGTLVSGGCGLILFALWEILMPLEEPYLPLHLFRNGPYQCAVWVTSIGAMTYFAFTLIWPQAVSRLYTDFGFEHTAILSGLATMCFVFGQISGSFLANWLPVKTLLIAFVFIGSPLLAAAAANPLDEPLTVGLVATGILFIGLFEGIAICSTTFPLKTQEELGTAGGLSGTIRSFGSVLATVIYQTILTNRLNTTVPAQVTPAAINAGLPRSSVAALLKELLASSPVTPTPQTVPGLNDRIWTASMAAYKVAAAQSYRTVFLSTLSFGGIAMILVWFTTGTQGAQGDFVAGHIHRWKDEKRLEEE